MSELCAFHSGIKCLDRALSGGLCSGEILEISSNAASVSTELGYCFVASALLSGATCIVLDGHGGFALSQLQRVIRSTWQMKHASRGTESRQSGQTEEDFARREVYDQHVDDSVLKSLMSKVSVLRISNEVDFATSLLGLLDCRLDTVPTKVERACIGGIRDSHVSNKVLVVVDTFSSFLSSASYTSKHSLMWSFFQKFKSSPLYPTSAVIMTSAASGESGSARDERNMMSIGATHKPSVTVQSVIASQRLLITQTMSPTRLIFRVDLVRSCLARPCTMFFEIRDAASDSEGTGWHELEVFSHA